LEKEGLSIFRGSTHTHADSRKPRAHEAFSKFDRNRTGHRRVASANRLPRSFRKHH